VVNRNKHASFKFLDDFPDVQIVPTGVQQVYFPALVEFTKLPDVPQRDRLLHVRGQQPLCEGLIDVAALDLRFEHVLVVAATDGDDVERKAEVLRDVVGVGDEQQMLAIPVVTHLFSYDESNGFRRIVIDREGEYLEGPADGESLAAPDDVRSPVLRQHRVNGLEGAFAGVNVYSRVQNVLYSLGVVLMLVCEYAADNPVQVVVEGLLQLAPRHAALD